MTHQIEYIKTETGSNPVVNIYFDKELMEKVVTSGKLNPIEEPKKQKVSKGFISLMILMFIIPTFVAVYVLDQTGVVPSESTVITNFIYKIINFFIA